MHRSAPIVKEAVAKNVLNQVSTAVIGFTTASLWRGPSKMWAGFTFKFRDGLREVSCNSGVEYNLYLVAIVLVMVLEHLNGNNMAMYILLSNC